MNLTKEESKKQLFLRTKLEVSRGAVVQSVTANATGCGFDPHSRN